MRSRPVNLGSLVAIGVFQPRLDTGVVNATAACAAPGSVATAARMRSTSAVRAGPCAASRWRSIDAINTERRSKPASLDISDDERAGEETGGHQ